MPPPPPLFHALLRPSILQILRATGFHSTRPAVLDTLTDLAARYLTQLAAATAQHAAANNAHPAFAYDGTVGDAGDACAGVTDVRMALQDVGAVVPGEVVEVVEGEVWRVEREVRRKRKRGEIEEEEEEEVCWGQEDVRGMEDFIAWFSSARMKELQALMRTDGDPEPTDYLNRTSISFQRRNILTVAKFSKRSTPNQTTSPSITTQSSGAATTTRAR